MRLISTSLFIHRLLKLSITYRQSFIIVYDIMKTIHVKMSAFKLAVNIFNE